MKIYSNWDMYRINMLQESIYVGLINTHYDKKYTLFVQFIGIENLKLDFIIKEIKRTYLRMNSDTTIENYFLIII